MTAYYVIPDRFDLRIDKSTYIEIISELNKLGMTIKVLTSFKSQKYINKEKGFFPIYFSAMPIPLLFRVHVLLKMLFYILRAAKKGDIIIVSPEALGIFGILKILKGVKLHLDVRTLPVIIKNSFKERVDNSLSYKYSLQLFGGFADSCSFITEYMKDEVKRLYGYSPKSYCCWSSGVSLDNFKISAKEEKNKTVNFFYHGSVTETRGIGLLYDAFKKLLNAENRNIRLLIVGGGPYLDTLKQRIEDDNLDEKVIAYGYVDYQKILDYIRKADICVCPLPNRVEWNVSSPIKIFEYMAMGKPIVCTDIPAHKNILENQPFAVFVKDSVESIADGMEQALVSLDKLSKYSKAERKYSEKFTWEKQASTLYSYLKKQACSADAL